MAFNYKNPTAGNTVTGPSSVTSLDRTYGTNYSVYNIGGYMEVENISDLKYTVEGNNVIRFSGNTIPVEFYLSPNPLADKIFLWNDSISSGRRRLGMLVYVQETQLTYQYTIDNYQSLYSAAQAAGVIFGDPFVDTKLEVRNKIGVTPNAAGQALVDAWTGSTVEGISGVTRIDARWRIFYGSDVTVTGGTYSNGTAAFTNSTGGTFNVTGFTTGGSVSYTSWFAEGDNQAPAVPIDVVDTFTLKFTGVITSGGAGIATDSAISANEMTIGLINNGGSPTDKTFYRGDGEWQTPTDTKLTGGTYNNSTGIVQLKNSDSSTVTLTGFTTGATEDTYVTGMSYNQVTKTLTLGLNDGVDFTAGTFAAEVTGGTYSGGSITLNNNDGTTSQVTGLEILTHIGLVNDSNVSISGSTVDSVNTSTYRGAFFDYVIDDGTNYRAGTVQSVWSSTDIQFNDSSTVDIGTTNNFSWGMELDGNNALLKANILGGTWNIRIIKHII